MENLQQNSDITLTLVAACGPRGELGLHGSLPWRQPADLAFFKKITLGGVVVCGRKTFESLPKLLPNRRHIVVSRQKLLNLPPEVTVVSDWQQLVEQLQRSEQKSAFLIGGAQLYEQWGPKAQYCWITHFGLGCEADCFFPLEILRGRPIVEQHHHEANGVDWPRTHVLYGAQPNQIKLSK